MNQDPFGNVTPTAVPKEISDRILKSVGRALQEEKVPKTHRYLKVILASLVTFLLLSTPFFLVINAGFQNAWTLAFIMWGILIVAGFSLYFQPQPRLLVRGVWMPFVFARLILVSVICVMMQILICPSMVFLESPLQFNPLEPLTTWLMDQGGMSFCMSFCGFFFAFVSGLLGVGSIYKVLNSKISIQFFILIGLLTLTQFPLVWVQYQSEGLREFLPMFLSGSLAGSLLSLVSTVFFTALAKRH